MKPTVHGTGVYCGHPISRSSSIIQPGHNGPQSLYKSYSMCLDLAVLAGHFFITASAGLPPLETGTTALTSS